MRFTVCKASSEGTPSKEQTSRGRRARKTKTSTMNRIQNLKSCCILLLLTNVSSGLFVPKILYESNRILAIDKPAGIAHHTEEDELGIISLLQEYYRSTSKASRLYGVHRLDRVTSGILVLAKDPEMAGWLSKQFPEKTIVKYYIGISHRKPKKKKQGWIKGKMTRGRRKSWYLESSTESSTNCAVTRFYTAGLGAMGEHCLPTKNTTLSSANSDDELLSAKTCLLFRPHTGKTHQLRVAAKSVGLPLLGDPIYSPDTLPSAMTGNNRTFLHATAIHIPLPTETDDRDEQQKVTIWSPPPFAPMLWNEEIQCDFDQIVYNLFDKYCECPEILRKAKSLLR